MSRYSDCSSRNPSFLASSAPQPRSFQVGRGNAGWNHQLKSNARRDPPLITTNEELISAFHTSQHRCPIGPSRTSRYLQQATRPTRAIGRRHSKIGSRCPSRRVERRSIGAWRRQWRRVFAISGETSCISPSNFSPRSGSSESRRHDSAN